MYATAGGSRTGTDAGNTLRPIPAVGSRGVMAITPVSGSSSGSSGTGTGTGSAPLDAATQIQDIRIFERNITKSVNSLRTLRRRYLVVISLLVLSSIYWTWRLQAKLTSTSALDRAPQELIRLLLAWAIIGIIPTILVMVAMYQSTVVMPSRFVERLNRSLVDYHVAYAADTGRLLRTTARGSGGGGGSMGGGGSSGGGGGGSSGGGGISSYGGRSGSMSSSHPDVYQRSQHGSHHHHPVRLRGSFSHSHSHSHAHAHSHT